MEPKTGRPIAQANEEKRPERDRTQGSRFEARVTQRFGASFTKLKNYQADRIAAFTGRFFAYLNDVGWLVNPDERISKG
jgi:hypothetical protein